MLLEANSSDTLRMGSKELYPDIVELVLVVTPSRVVKIVVLVNYPQTLIRVAGHSNLALPI